MANYALAPAAYADLEEVDAYTLAKWGATKRAEYIRGLFGLFEDLTAFPGLGTSRPDIAEFVRSTVYERLHVVFYEVIDERCFILRVLHHSRDVSSAVIAVGNVVR